MASIATVPAEGIISVLLICPRDSRRWALRQIFTPPQWELREVSTYRQAVEILDDDRIAVAICDTDIADGNWQTLLAELQTRTNPPPLIVSSRLADERLWGEVLNLGAYDVLVQPFDRAEVLRVARMAWMAWRRESQRPAADAAALAVGSSG
jgi:DNA-binding NtrC family response regulator